MLWYARLGLLVAPPHARLQTTQHRRPRMAWQHIHLVRELDLPHVEKLVLFALASRVDESGECWPSVATLRKDTGLAQRTVQYRLRSLVAHGLVSCEERRGATTVLRLHLCEPCASAPQSGVQDGDDKAHTMH